MSHLSKLRKPSVAVPKDNISSNPFFVNNRQYLDALRDIGQTLQVVVPHASEWLRGEVDVRGKKLHRLLSQNQTVGKEAEIHFKTARDYAEFITTLKEFGNLQNHRGVSVLTRSLFMQMFSEFDTFIGGLLRSIYQKNDDLYKGIKREISFSELMDYPDIDSIKLSTLNKEIDGFRRDSYIEQFTGLETRFGLPLKKFDEWGKFVELSQRRNILTHNGGIVGEQYILVCKREGYKFDVEPELDKCLEIDLEYFNGALRLMSKVGFMLTHTLWRKILPGESNLIHESINNTLYELLEQKRWKIASELGIFALSDLMRKDISDIDLRIRVINVAIAHKFSNEMELAQKLLNEFDWSASYRDFKLAISVLVDDFPEASRLMKSIGRNGEIIRQNHYHQWPLFFKFKKHQEFFVAYEQVYGEPFSESISDDAVGEKLITVDVDVKAAPKKRAAKKSPARKSSAVKGRLKKID